MGTVGGNDSAGEPFEVVPIAAPPDHAPPRGETNGGARAPIAPMREPGNIGSLAASPLREAGIREEQR